MKVDRSRPLQFAYDTVKPLKELAFPACRPICSYSQDPIAETAGRMGSRIAGMFISRRRWASDSRRRFKFFGYLAHALQ